MKLLIFTLGVAKLSQIAPIEMPSMIKLMTTKPIVSSVSVSFSIFAYGSTRVQY